MVGHSWGGSVALAAAIANKSDLSGLVLLAPAAYPNVTVEWWSFLPLIPWLGKLAVKTLTPVLGPAIVKASLKDAYHPQSVHLEYVQRCAALWTKPDRVRAFAYDEKTLRASLQTLSPHYAKIDLPVMIVTGTADRVIDPEQHAFPLHRTIKHSKLVVLPETGHQLPHTRPDVVVSAVDAVWYQGEKL